MFAMLVQVWELALHVRRKNEWIVMTGRLPICELLFILCARALLFTRLWWVSLHKGFTEVFRDKSSARNECHGVLGLLTIWFKHLGFGTWRPAEVHASGSWVQAPELGYFG